MSTTDIAILRHLLDASPKYCPGNSLVHASGLSPDTLLERMSVLRREGFRLDGDNQRGHRILSEPTGIYAPLIRTYLERRAESPQLLIFPEIDSTNSEADRQLGSGRDTPFIVLAEKQMHGRGQLGRQWYSPEEGNIYMSFVFERHFTYSRLQVFTLWMGLSICRLLNKKCRAKVGIKWPNDLVLHDRKLGGMLTESRGHTAGGALILGLGLNINSSCAHWPADLAQNAISIADAGGEPIRVNLLAADLVSCGLQAYEEFISGGFASDFGELWREYDTLHGREVCVSRGEGLISGKVQGIDKKGHLQLLLGDHRLVQLPAGEVTLGSSAVLHGG